MGLILFYPSPIFEKEDVMSEEFNQKLEKWIVEYSEKDEAAKNWSQKFYGAGFTSFGSNQTLHKNEPLFQELAKGLIPSIKEFLQELKAVEPKEIYCVGMWCSINKPKSMHPRHIHPMSACSGTYYVNADPEMGNIFIHDPYDNRQMGINFKPDSPLAFDTYAVPVKSRKVIMFPGWVSHSVQQNMSDKDRIGVSFNFQVRYDESQAQQTQSDL